MFFLLNYEGLTLSSKGSISLKFPGRNLKRHDASCQSVNLAGETSQISSTLLIKQKARVQAGDGVPLTPPQN